MPPPTATAPPLDDAPLADTRLTAVDEADLRWYLCESAGAMGERSALGAMIDRLNEGRSHTGASGTPDLPDAQYFAARAAAPIAARLKALTRLHREVIEATYGPGLTPYAQDKYGTLSTGRTLPAALVLLMARRQRISEKKLDGWLTPPTPPERPDLTDKPKAEARRLLDAHAKATAAQVEQWRRQQADHLRPLRLAALDALARAHDAYRATIPLYPRQPRGRVEAE